MERILDGVRTTGVCHSCRQFLSFVETARVVAGFGGDGATFLKDSIGIQNPERKVLVASSVEGHNFDCCTEAT